MWFMRNTKPCDYPENTLEDRKNEVGWKEKASPARWGSCVWAGRRYTAHSQETKEERGEDNTWELTASSAGVVLPFSRDSKLKILRRNQV